MKIFRKHTLFYLSLIFVIGGLVCLNTHTLSHHLNDQQTNPPLTDSDSVPVKNITDNCVLCILSAFGFAEPEDTEFIPVYNENEQVTHPSLSFLSQQAVFVTAPRAPPFS